MRTRFAIGGGNVAAALLLATCLAAVPAAAQSGSGQRYELEARLDPAQRTVEGQLHLTWRNDSRAPVTELYFHLYPNAFASNETVFMREGGASIRGGRLRRFGGLDLTRLALADGTDLLKDADSALVARDATQLRVPLPRAVAPGASLELQVTFRVRLPSLLARMGAAADFFMIAQWFPKLARLEPDGRWASFPYHGLGEFYADFADYDLRVELPDGYVLAAPGEPRERRALPGGMHSERYVLRNALDVAWAAAPRMQRTTRQAGRVRIDVFAPPGQLALSQRQAELVQAGLARFGAKLGAYPHDRIVLVLPPRDAVGAAGMEYPGLIVGWTASAFTRINPASAALHDVVTAHELAHQWFPMLAASNEPEQPLLDEGLAEWLGLDLIRERFAAGTLWPTLLGVPIEPFELTRVGYAGARAVPSSLSPAYRLKPSQLGPAIYLRPALAFETVSRTWGAARFWSALSGYARGQRFAHPTLADLLRAFDAAYWPGFSASVLRPALEGVASDTELAVTARAPGPALRAERTQPGALRLPLRVELEDVTGARTSTPWPAAQQALALEPAPARELRGARIDPQRHNLLDRDAGDDSVRLSDRAAQPPLLPRILLWAQSLLGLVGP